MIQDIYADETKKLIEENQDNPNFIILDIRTPPEFSEGHIKNAINIDMYDPEFESKIMKLDINKTYLLYCRSGSRSSYSLNLFEKYKFHKIFHLFGGILNWLNEGYDLFSN